MQGYTYSVFSGIAIAIHFIINFKFLASRGAESERTKRYRDFLFCILAYYVADAGWGVVSGLGWPRALYVFTILYFLSNAAFVVTWNRFAVVYLGCGGLLARTLAWCGHAVLAIHAVLLAANVFTGCMFHIDAQGTYITGPLRDLPFYLLAGINALLAAAALARAAGSRDSVRRRSLMVLLSSVTMTAAIMLQVALPLTPFTALGCLVVNCFLHVFVISDEQAARHMAELEVALERARAAGKAREMFFSIVSHDIRTPLNAILGYAELLQSGITDQTERDEALKSIRASGTTLLQLVNDVLDLAKMDAGKMTLMPSPVDLGRLTDEVFASFRLAAAGKGVVLFNRATGVPTVMLDGHRLRQILFNLVGNAVKFTSQGAVTVEATYSGSTLEFAVSDTGCGIPQDMLPHILDPFVQVQDPSHSADRAVGTGLGLPICQRLVDVMGGELTVDSELGRGSVFRARIPGIAKYGDEAVFSAAASPSGAAPVVKLPGRVLVIDDSPVNRAVLTAFLKKAGVREIDLAGDGQEALAKLVEGVKAGRPHDFILSDFWMPNMNGLEFVERLRADPRLARIHACAVTADTESRNDARAALFDGIMLKPLTYSKLMEAFAAADSQSPGRRP